MSETEDALPSGAVVHVWRPAARPAIGVVVLQHGFGEHAGRFVTQHHQLVGHLVGAGLEVWAMDLLGHGRSPGRRAVTDVRCAVVDHLALRSRAGESGLPMVLLGHSLGGLVTAASAATDPSGLAGVVLTSPALPDPPGFVVRRLLLGLAVVRPGLRLSWMHQPLSMLARLPGHEEATRADPLMYLGPLTGRTGATALEVAATLWHFAGAWSLPTFVLHGTADQHTDHRDSERFARATGAELRLVDGGLHELLDDLGGDDVLALVLALVLDWVQRGGA